MFRRQTNKFVGREGVRGSRAAIIDATRNNLPQAELKGGSRRDMTDRDAKKADPGIVSER